MTQPIRGDTPIWDAALESAKDRIDRQRLYRYKRKRNNWFWFLVDHPDLTYAIYLEGLARQSPRVQE